MKKVLVIEDNKDNLKLISYALRRAGYEVVSAETGEEGAEAVADVNPCFIIMDINLPGIDGIEATKRIKSSKAGKSLPVIAITSYAMRGDREKIMHAGCSGYFEKPIDPLTIMDRIIEIIGGSTDESIDY